MINPSAEQLKSSGERPIFSRNPVNNPQNRGVSPKRNRSNQQKMALTALKFKGDLDRKGSLRAADRAV
jgi:hypothetical protein